MIGPVLVAIVEGLVGAVMVLAGLLVLALVVLGLAARARRGERGRGSGP